MSVTLVSILSASAAVAVSTPVAVNWRCGAPVLWQVVVSSSVATGDFTVQYSLDDLQLTAYSTIYPPTGSPTAPIVNAWTGVSSAATTSISTGIAAFHFTSSSIFPDGVSGTFPAPPAAIRLFSTNTSSGALTLRVIQGDHL